MRKKYKVGSIISYKEDNFQSLSGSIITKEVLTKTQLGDKKIVTDTKVISVVDTVKDKGLY